MPAPGGSTMSLAAAICAACLLGPALQVNAQLRIMSPQSLLLDAQFRAARGRIDGTTATFGAPFYGDRVLGHVIWPLHKANTFGCNDADYDISPVDQHKNDDEQVRLISIIMVRRGMCSFTTKVRVAAAKGAHAVLFVDRENSTLTNKTLRNVIVADDGFGGQIQIPSVLIDKEDGGKLIAAARSYEKVIVELAWDVPTNTVVSVDLWMSSASQESMKFLTEFAPKRRTLNRVVTFIPHYAVFAVDDSYSEASDLCIWDGDTPETRQSYCAEDPDGPGPITGKEVLKEDVRQLCIHELYKKTTARIGASIEDGGLVEYAEEYWSYMEKFRERCLEDGSKFGLDCSTSLMKEVRIDQMKVQNCAAITSIEKLAAERRNSAWSPRALRINQWRYSGILDADLVTRAICSGFITQPKECKDIIRPRNPFEAFSGATQANGVSFGTLILWLGLTLALAFSCLLLYKRYLKKEMRSTLREEVMLEVQAQMGQYSKMSQ